MPYPVAAARGKQGSAATSVLASVPWVAQWKFNNDGNDSIGANHLTNNNSATFTTGLLGGATGATSLVKASSQYWSIVDNAALSVGSNIDFTVAAWVYLNSKPAAIMGIASKGDGSTFAAYEYALDWVNTSDRFEFGLSDGVSHLPSATANSFGAPALSTWYLVIGWYDSVLQTLNISVNNGATDSAAATFGGYNGTGAFRIGYFVATSSRYWDGRIDNVCIAKSAAGLGGVLSAAQRTAFYNGGVGNEAITAAMEYQRQQRNLWREIGRLWEQQKRGWFEQGRGLRVFA